MINICYFPDQFIIASTDPVHHPVFFARFFDANDNFGSFLPLSYELYDHIHRILEVRAHPNHTVPGCLFQSVDRRAQLTEVSGIKDCLYVFILCAQFPQIHPRSVLGMIVDKQDLIPVFRKFCLHHCDNGFCQRFYIPLFIVCGYHHRDFLFHLSFSFIQRTISRIPLENSYAGSKPVSFFRLDISAHRCITGCTP